MASSRNILRSLIVPLTLTIGVSGLVACSDRLEPPTPEKHDKIESMAQWASARAEPYGIPQRQLQAYAYAAFSVREEMGCNVGWPTLAALGAVLSDHGQKDGTTVGSDGITSKPLRGISPAAGGLSEVPDTDAGSIDGESQRDVPVGPMQLMPSRWEQLGTSVEPGQKPNPDQIDDAVLTTAHMLCSSGDPSSPEGWVAAISQFNPSKIFIVAVHNKAEEYSR